MLIRLVCVVGLSTTAALTGDKPSPQLRLTQHKMSTRSGIQLAAAVPAAVAVPAAPAAQSVQLFAVCTIVFVHLLGLGMGLNTLPEHMTSEGYSPSQIGSVISCFSVGQLLGGPSLVALSRRAGRLPVLQASLLVAAVSQWGTASSSTLASFALLRFMLGLGAAVGGVAAAAVADLVSPSGRTAALGQVQAANSLGIVVGPTAAYLLDAVFSRLGVPRQHLFRAIYRFSTALFLAALGVSLATAPHDARAAKCTHAANAQGTTAPREPTRTVGAAITTVGVATAATAASPSALRAQAWRQWALRYVAFTARWKLLMGFLFYGPQPRLFVPQRQHVHSHRSAIADTRCAEPGLVWQASFRSASWRTARRTLAPRSRRPRPCPSSSSCGCCRCSRGAWASMRRAPSASS
jgi:MFS family permease